MPLAVTDYTWTQTEATIHIQVPLKGARPDAVDLVTTDEYIKVSFPPFLLEIFLLEPVDDGRSLVKLGGGVALFHLRKRNNNIWSRLMMESDDKEKKKQMREAALLKYQEKLQAQAKSRREKEQEEKKFALKTMMKLEQDERENIQRVKEEERERTTAELEVWQQREREKERQRKEEEEEKVQREREKQTEERIKGKTKEPREKRPAGSDATTGGGRREVKKEKNKKEGPLPAPRAAGNIHINFTPRVFPTALRESRVQEEEEWLRKQAECRRRVGGGLEDEDLKDLKEEERNADWLKDKGDKYFVGGDFLSAVNAYNLAIRLNRRTPALFSNRAACHLKLRNLHKAVEDASQALNLLTPAVAANAAARARAHVRRGSAFCQLELYVEALQDYQAALKIHPDNQELQEDERRIRDIVQGTHTRSETHSDTHTDTHRETVQV